MSSRKDKLESIKINHEMNNRDVGYDLIEREYRKAAKNTAKRRAVKEGLKDYYDS